MYATRWRLIYLDDRFLDEKLDGSPIVDRRPNPVELRLINIHGQEMLSVPIPPGCKPIFYRNRSIEQKPGGAMGEVQLDATVFGYGREEGINGGGKLWVWRRGQAMDCPPEHVAPKAIELQLQA